MNLEEEPEEPHLHSEASLLSPASPKPIHFPTPTNIPVLNNMMDVSFNQTELHMQDPSMRNTEVREGAWKDTDAQEDAPGDEDAPVEGEPMQSTQEQPVIDTMPEIQESHDTNAQLNSQIELAQHIDPAAAENDATAAVSDTALLNDNSLRAPTTLSVAEGTPMPDVQAQPSSFSLPSNVDVQSLLASLQAAPVSHSTNATPAAVQQDIPATDLAGTTVTTTSVTEPTSAHDQLPAVSATTVTVAQPGDDLVSALTRGITPAAGTSVAFQHVDSAATPSAQAANGALQPRVPSSQRERKLAAGEPVTQEDMPWTADIQQKYDEFIQEERRYVNDGKWDQFPMGSRLFVGNLSSESVTKRDIFHVFHTYGPLAQISIKQAYGFVQFLYADDCDRALNTEQGTMIKDKRIHLEISKPQKARNQNRNRSRSPVNRGSGRSGNDRNQSGRDSYRAMRSPSPRGAYRDRYDDRQRNRQRSPPGYGRSRYTRSPSPRRIDAEDDLPLPRRAPQDVPEVQIIVKEQNIDRRLIEMVENTIGAARFRTAVLVLKPNLNEDAAIQRQLVEGVLAIVRLDRRSMETGRVMLRIFDRSMGADRVQFNDYDYIDVTTCVGLLDRARGASRLASTPAQYGMPMQQQPPSYAQPPPMQYGYGAPSAPPQPYALPPGYPPQYQAQQPAVHPPHGLPQQLDPASLQNLLTAARNGQPPQQARPPMTGGPYGYPPQAAYSQPPPPQQAYANANSWMQQQQQSAARAAVPPSAPPGGQVNMQDILARLGTYKQ
ncbi:hypothetical protein AMS68_005657 [Peltaster fructicola]|uniref:RRM domain-containing protein n=1 Tax=Peltaster fructicola TaxID=286661 RepID=A0A6H0Y0G8_9PEZI|nr:hypothetical protein AMS68_005657 [Peltaster fructicola]